MKMRELISVNLLNLQKHAKVSQTAFAESCKIPQRTLNRITNMETTAKLEQLEKIAKANDLQVWQLLIHDLDVTNPLMLAKESESLKVLYKKIETAFKELPRDANDIEKHNQ